MTDPLISPSCLRLGQPNEPAAPVPLKAGLLTALFEPDTGFLRHIRIGDHEVLRGIHGAVRDRNWDTPPASVENLSMDLDVSGFKISFQSVCRTPDIHFVWQTAITGEASGRITYRFDGAARSSFLRNRIGLFALHPLAECAGKPCSVLHDDGSVTEGTFPKFIAPAQPFKNIRAITSEPAPGVKATVEFDGDTFEMEDHRNWTDASFKTYCTPLDLPFPAQVNPGDRVEQSVTVHFPGPVRKILPILQGRGAQCSIATTPVLPMPPLGLRVASHGQPLTPREVDRLKRLNLSHLRADLDFANPDWPAAFEASVRQSGQLGVGLHWALHLTDDAESDLKRLAESWRAAQPRVALVLVFDRKRKATCADSIRLAGRILSGLAPNLLLAAGTDANFAELNRDRPPADAAALPCYSINPQVHAFDALSLVETLAAQPATVESARQFAPRSVVISPVTLRPRSNPNATASVPPPGPDALPQDVDPRQMSLFGAAWTLGSIARLAAAGSLHSLTYYETTGWKGVLETESGPPLPDLFPSIPGGVFPVYHVFADLAGRTRLYPTHSSHPLQTESMTVLDAGNRRRILAVNLMNHPQEIKIKTGTCKVRIRYLDETNAEEAMRDPEAFAARPGVEAESVSGKIDLSFKPYGLARVDVV